MQAVGEAADDGVPEPLLFILNDQTRLMLVPTGGFGWLIVRISKGSFSPEHSTKAEAGLAASEAALREALEAMPGLIHYYVAIDRDHGQLTNVSVWDTLEHAKAMSSLAPMLAQLPVMEAAGIKFETITNYDCLWTITP